MIRAQLTYVLFHIFRTFVTQLKIKDQKIKQHLNLLIKIFALDILTKDGAPAFDSGYLGKGALSNMQKALS